MKSIAQITLPQGFDIDLMFDNGKLAYSFTHEGKAYGNAVKLPSRKVSDIAAACMILFTNALESREQILKSNESHT